MRRTTALRRRGVSPRARKGFSLIEVAVSTAIIGLGVAALMVSVGSQTRVNGAGKKITQAAFLAQELREWTLRLPFSDPDPHDAGNPPGPDGTDPAYFVDDLDDLYGYNGAGVTYCPPRDGQGSSVADLTDWTEHISLQWVHEGDPSVVVEPGASRMVFVTLTVSHRTECVLTTGWLVTGGEQ